MKIVLSWNIFVFYLLFSTFSDSVFLGCYSEDKVDADRYILLPDSFSFLYLVLHGVTVCGVEQFFCVYFPLEFAFWLFLYVIFAIFVYLLLVPACYV